MDVLRGIAPSHYNAQMYRRSTVLALSAILLPSGCFARGRDGHRIAGCIAAKYLTPQAAAAVKNLLGYAHDKGGNDIKVGAERHA